MRRVAALPDRISVLLRINLRSDAPEPAGVPNNRSGRGPAPRSRNSQALAKYSSMAAGIDATGRGGGSSARRSRYMFMAFRNATRTDSCIQGCDGTCELTKGGLTKRLDPANATLHAPCPTMQHRPQHLVPEERQHSKRLEQFAARSFAAP